MFLASSALAAGFQVDVHGSRATGMATAVTASVDDASSVFFNPAGLAGKKGLDIYLGDTLIIPSFTYSGPDGTTKTTPGVIPPPHLYVAYGITDSAAVGVGLFSLYGSAIHWPNNSTWPGRFQITDSTLSTYYINPEVAFKVGMLHVGVGVQVVRATVDLKRQTNFFDSETEATTELGGGSWGVGGNLGVQVDAIPKILQFGATYRSGVKLNFDGNAHFSNVPSEFAGAVRDQALRTSVTLPDTLALGVAVHPIPTLLVGFDAVYTAWQKLHDLSFHFDDPSLDQVEYKRWHSTVNFHLGSELNVSDNFDVRLGLLLDPTASPSSTLGPDLPDSTRLNIAAGVGFHTGGFRADLGYQYVIIMKTTSTNPVFGNGATYNGNAQVLGLSIGYRL